ncbi:MAG: carboxypeptidase regulatory-like domain-containing protein, partial [Chloroflexi bacterium]|nr:carboxypeptidase regulatory-like domain-containing protein [Chloroflexota bacterium]
MTRRPAPRGRARRRPLPILAFVVAALAAFLMPAVRPDPVDAQATLNSQATLTVLTAPVEVQRASGNRDSASSGTTVVVGDRVFTGTGGAAKLTFFQGTEVDIAPDSEVMVQEMTQRVSGASTVSFGQAVGSTVAKVASLFNPASRVQVSTQSAVAVVRGTELEVTVTKEQVQVFRSNTGSFDVIAGGQTQRVKDGEVTVVPPPPPPAPPPTTRDTKTIGDATVSLPSGNDRPPLPPVPVAEIDKLFEKVSEITAKDGPRVVATPPVAARDLIDVAQGKPVVLRPLGAKPVQVAATPPPAPVAATPVPVKLPPATPEAKATPAPQQTSSGGASSPAPTATSGCSTLISTATPSGSETRFKGSVVDGAGTPIAGACVEAGNYTNTSRASSVTDASGTFRIIIPTPATSGASSTYALVASVDGYTQAAIPTLTAALGQTNNPLNISLYRDDTTISGKIGSGTGSVPAAGAVASLVIEVPTPTSYSGDVLRVHVAEGTASSSGDYRISAVATNTFSYVVAEQKSVSPYGYRAAGAPVPSLTSGSTSTLDMVLPTLNVTSPLTCEQYGAPCSATVSGTGWSSGQYVILGAKGPDGIRRTFDSVPVSGSEFASQSVVATDPTWPLGNYTLFASQGQGSTERYLEWGTSYVVSAGTASSCGTNI